MNTEAVAQLVSVLEKTISPDQTELKEYTYLIGLKFLYVHCTHYRQNYSNVIQLLTRFHIDTQGCIKFPITYILPRPHF